MTEWEPFHWDGCQITGWQHMRLTITLVLMAAATLVGGSFLNAARSAEMIGPRVSETQASGAVPTRGLTDAVRKRLRFEAARREEADKRRQARTERLTGSVCIGCGGPVVPFDPSGGESVRKKVSATREGRR